MKNQTGALLLAIVTCISAASMEPLLYGMQEAEEEHAASGTITGSALSTHGSQPTSSASRMSSHTPQDSSAREISITQAAHIEEQPAETIFFVATRSQAETILQSIRRRNLRSAVQEPLEPPSRWERVKDWFRGWCRNPEPFMSDEELVAFISVHMQQAFEQRDFAKIEMYKSLVTARNQEAILNNQNSASRNNSIMTMIAAGLVILMPFLKTTAEACECVCQ